MGGLSSIVAAVAQPIAGFVKEVREDMARIEKAKAEQARAPKLEDMSEDELQLILKHRARNNQSAHK